MDKQILNIIIKPYINMLNNNNNNNNNNNE